MQPIYLLTLIPPRGILGHVDQQNGAIMHGYSQDTEKYLKRLRRIEGQVRGVQRMVTEDKYCIDVLTQISAIQSALDSVALGLLEDHLAHCVFSAANEGEEVQKEKIHEASQAIARLVKS